MKLDPADRSDGERTDTNINRREYVAAVSAAASGLLAGCQSGPSGGDTDTPGGGDTDTPGDGGMTTTEGETTTTQGQELGERVPSIQHRVWAGLGDSTEEYLAATPIIEQGAEEILGININMKPVDIGSILSKLQASREIHSHHGGGPIDPNQLEPFNALERFHIRNVGNSPTLSLTQYAGSNVCEISRKLEDLQNATSPDEVESLAHEIMQLSSEDVTVIPINNRVVFGAYRNDQITLGSPGAAGILKANPKVFINATTKGDQDKIINVARNEVETNNPLSVGASSSKYLWNHVFFSPLKRFDENWEIENVLATTEEVTNDFRTVRYEIREGAVFHNGDPITAEDVKWTYEFLTENSPDLRYASPWEYESIEVVDEHTVEFNFPNPTPPWVKTAATFWGIYPKDVWTEQGITDVSNVASFSFPSDEYVGSGPYQLDSFTSGQLARGVPFEDHWNAPEDPITYQMFQDIQSAGRAFRQGNINFMIGVSAQQVKPLQEEDFATVRPTNGFVGHVIYPLQHFGPFKHREFRMAFSQTIDRRQVVEVAKFGFGHPVLHSSSQLSYEWPLYPPKDTMTKVAETERSNPEAAKQVLRDAGWGWDDDGRLHYPPDADLEPLWGPEESPLDYPDRWPCVTELELGERLPVEE